VWASAVGVSTVLAGLSTALLFANRSATIARSATITSVVIHVGTVVAAIVTAAPIPVLLVRVLLAPVEWMIDGLFLDKSLRRAALHPRWPHRMPAGFWRFAGLAGLSIALQLVVFTRSEVFVFSLYGEATALGLYALAFGIAQQITAPLEGLIAPLMPAMAGLVESHRDHIARGSLRAVRLLALFTGAVVALLPAVAFSVPMIFGREFATAGALVVPLGLAAALRVVASPATVLVYALRRGKTLVAANGTALALDAALALALIPVVGVWGAVVAALAAQSASVVITSRAWLRMDEVTIGDALTAASSWLAGLLTVPLSLAAGAAVGSMVGDVAAVVVAAAVGSMSFLALARQQQAGLLMGDSPAVLGALPSASRTAVAGLLRLAGAPDAPRPTAPVAARTDLGR
jgi:O-antigen/teichoic acid export membrane protein